MNATIMKTGIASKVLILLVAAALVGSALMLSGCPDRVTGDQTANKKPIVYFVNVPPSGYNTSRNPILYWVGTDPDGQVKMFRYAVVLVSEMGGKTPEDYMTQDLPALPEERWTYLRVNDSLPDPQTSQIVRMSASLTNPVNEFVPQYVYLQAFDEQNKASDYAFRLYKRNDNPPQTTSRALDFTYPDNPYINAKTSGGIITGVRLQWGGEDKLDYPSDVPPFEYQWKVLGPYTFDTLTGGEYKQVFDQFMSKVFVANDGQLYKLGQGEKLIFYCDTLDTAAEPDTLVHYACDSLLVDTVSASNSYGTLDSMLRVDDPDFQNSSLFRLVDTSKSDLGDGWISNTGDTLYDLYRDAANWFDTTVTMQRRFILWVRCRDDANVPDLTPRLDFFDVIEPRYERDVLLMDFMKVFYRYNAPFKDTVFQYWNTVLRNWNPNITFDTSDYYILNVVSHGDDIDLSKLLQYKVVILYNDDVRRSDIIGNAGPSRAALKVYKAVDAGVNVWLTMRSPGKAGIQSQRPADQNFPEVPDLQYQRYFGIRGLIYSGWWYMAITPPPLRIEDFVGTYTLKPGSFPELSVDTAQLHRRYEWGGSRPVSGTMREQLKWMDTSAFLPEVGWAARHYGTDPIYLYKSRYGGSHPLGGNSSYDGSPVAIRFQTNLFRTAHFSFTPLAIKDAEAQVVIDTILNWLYRPKVTAPETISRYPGAEVRLSAQEILHNDAYRAAELQRLSKFRSFSESVR